jgi:hypothetical protein
MGVSGQDYSSSLNEFDSGEITFGSNKRSIDPPVQFVLVEI